MIFRILSLCLFLSACQTNPTGEPPSSASAPSGSWQASTLSAATIAAANGAVKAYEKCLNEEALLRVNQDSDPRALGDQILSACEGRLSGVRSAYSAEGVPDSISERYMRQMRSRGAQSLMRFLQTVYAQKAASANVGASRARAR